MSRGGRDDDRTDDRNSAVDRKPDRAGDNRQVERRPSDWSPSDLTLARGQDREPVEFRGHTYFLDGDEARTLATVGAFRVVDTADIPGKNRDDDLRHLREQGLATQVTLTTRDGAHHVVSLTKTGRDLLDSHSATRPEDRGQTYYADVVKPRELAHDARLYAVFKEEAGRIEVNGGRIVRVLLDHELKREYQQFLNRSDRPPYADVDRDRRDFASAHELTIVDGHLELPDLRIEYESADGRLEHRDVELVTEHYSRGQLGGKSHAGFTCYRAGGRSGSTRTGGTPFDPRHLERL